MTKGAHNPYPPHNAEVPLLADPLVTGDKAAPSPGPPIVWDAPTTAWP